MNKHVLMIGRIGAGPSGGGWYRDDDGRALYKVRAGDTLGDLASKFLGSWGRYTEIWNAQPASRRAGGNPNAIRTGESLVMPAEAVARAIALGYLAAGAVAPSVTPPPFIPPAPVVPPLVVVNPPSAPTPTPTPPTPPKPAPSPSEGPSTALYVAGGVAAAAGLAGLAWLALRTPPRAARSARR